MPPDLTAEETEMLSMNHLSNSYFTTDFYDQAIVLVEADFDTFLNLYLRHFQYGKTEGLNYLGRASQNQSYSLSETLLGYLYSYCFEDLKVLLNKNTNWL